MALLASGQWRGQGTSGDPLSPVLNDALSILLSHRTQVHASLPDSSHHLLQSLKTRRGRFQLFTSTISYPPVLNSKLWAEKGPSLFSGRTLGWGLRAWFLTSLGGGVGPCEFLLGVPAMKALGPFLGASQGCVCREQRKSRLAVREVSANSVFLGLTAIGPLSQCVL